MRDIFRRRRMWRPRPDAQGLLRRRHHRRRLARPGHRLLPARARDHRRLRPREELHRLGRGRAQHDDPALELQDARGRALLRREREALRGPLAGAQLQPALLAVRPPHARALRPRDVRDGQPRRGQPPAGHRLAADRPRRGQAPGARPCTSGRRRDLSDHGRALPPARRHHPPRRRGLGPGPRRRRGRRGDPPLHRGHSASSARNGRVDAVRTNRGTIRAGQVVNCTAGWSTLLCDMAGVGAADHHPHPAGVRDRAGQAAARRGHRLLADARLHLADRPRRVPHGRRDRAVDDLPDAGHAELPAGGHAPHARALPPARARAAAALVGRACATSAPTTARSSARPRSRTSTSAPAGAPTASRPRRSSARRWPSSSTPAARPTSSPPSRSSASTRTGSSPSSPPPPSATNRPWSHREEQPRDRTGRGPQADRADRRGGRPRGRGVRALRALQGEDRPRRARPHAATRPTASSCASPA